MCLDFTTITRKLKDNANGYFINEVTVNEKQSGKTGLRGMFLLFNYREDALLYMP